MPRRLNVKRADLAHIVEALRPLAVPIEGLSTDPANARKHGERSIEAIKGSLRRFGQTLPILVDAKGVCVAGSGRLEAARALGWAHVAAVRTKLRGNERTAYAIADNRTAELSDWDNERLSERLMQLQREDGVDLAVTGFDDSEVDQVIDAAFDDLAARAEVIDDDGGGRRPVARVTESYGVIVHCEDQAQREQVMAASKAGGHSCRVVTR